jgi:hypothetical protein
MFGDWGTPGKVRSTIAYANDGTRTSNSVTITNDLGQSFYNGRVRFLMPKGKYRATGGEVEAQYDYANGTKTAVLVKINILKNATTSASVSKYVNFEDLADFVYWWVYDNCSSQNNCDNFDSNKDGVVDFADFANFAVWF